MSDTAPPPSRRRRALTTTVIIAVVLGIVAGVWIWRDSRTGTEFSARFTSSVGVYPGSDVRVLGVPVGKVDSVTPHGRTVTIGMHLDRDIAVRADTYAVIVSPNLVSDRYVQLTGAYDGGPKLRDGAVIGTARTRTPVELDELTRNLTSLTDALGPNGANATGALSRLLKVGAANLDGNGRKIRDTISRLSSSGRTLDASKNDIFGTIDQLSTFTRTLQQHDSALGSVNRNLAAVSQTLSNDRETFGQALRELGTALGLVQDFVRDNRGALTRNVDKLQTVAATLAKQRSSLAQTLRSAPLLLQNFLNAYDPKTNLLRGRANLNELTVWARGASASVSSAHALPTGGNAGGDTGGDTGGDASPPLLLPVTDNAASGQR